MLFDLIDEDGDGIPDKNYRKHFKVIYNGIVEKRDYKNGKMIEKGFNDKSSDTENILFEGDIAIKGKDFFVKYILVKD